MKDDEPRAFLEAFALAAGTIYFVVGMILLFGLLIVLFS